MVRGFVVKIWGMDFAFFARVDNLYIKCLIFVTYPVVLHFVTKGVSIKHLQFV